MKRLNNKTQFGRCILYAGLFIFPILLSACNSGSGTSSDTGSIAMSVEFLGAPSESKLNKIEVNQTAQLACGAESGVFWVKAYVYDEYDLNIAGGGDWPCEVHGGTITGVPAGTDRKVVILGKGDEPDKVIVYRGERRDISVTAGHTTNAGTIECVPFIPTLIAPENDSTVRGSFNFEWDPVTGASEYRIVVSEDSSLINPIIDATAENTTFTPPAAFSSGTTYYWQVRAHDRYGNVGGGSEPRNFTVFPYPNTVVGAPIPVGNNPRGLAVTPQGSYVYVTNHDDTPGTVSVIQTSTNTVVDTITIPVGIQPVVVAVALDGGYAYVANSTEGTPMQSGWVSKIETSTNTVVASIAVDYYPHGVAVTPDGSYVYVVNSMGDYDGTYGTVSVIETSTNTVVDTIVVDYWPLFMAVTPDGRYVYVAHYGNDTVSVIRTSDNTVVDTIPVGPGPYTLAVTPDGSYVYVANYDDEPTGTVSVIETSTNTVVDIDPIEPGIQGIEVGYRPYGVAVTPDGGYVYVGNEGGDTVSVIQTLGNKWVEDILVGKGAAAMVAVTPDGSYIYVTNPLNNEVSVIGFQ